MGENRYKYGNALHSINTVRSSIVDKYRYGNQAREASTVLTERSLPSNPHHKRTKSYENTHTQITQSSYNCSLAGANLPISIDQTKQNIICHIKHIVNSSEAVDMNRQVRLKKRQNSGQWRQTQTSRLDRNMVDVEKYKHKLSFNNMDTNNKTVVTASERRDHTERRILGDNQASSDASLMNKYRNIIKELENEAEKKKGSRQNDRRFTLGNLTNRRKTILYRDISEVPIKVTDVMRVFCEYCSKYLNAVLPISRPMLVKSKLEEFLYHHIKGYLSKLTILEDYEVDKAHIEQILTNIISKHIPTFYLPLFVDVYVKDVRFRKLDDNFIQGKINYLSTYLEKLKEKIQIMEVMKILAQQAEVAESIIFEIKSRHYEKLKSDVTVEFRKYRKNYLDLMVNKNKNSMFKKNIEENHEMIRAAKKFNTKVGTFDILDFIEKMKEQDGLPCQPSSKSFQINCQFMPW